MAFEKMFKYFCNNYFLKELLKVAMTGKKS